MLKLRGIVMQMLQLKVHNSSACYFTVCIFYRFTLFSLLQPRWQGMKLYNRETYLVFTVFLLVFLQGKHSWDQRNSFCRLRRHFRRQKCVWPPVWIQRLQQISSCLVLSGKGNNCHNFLDFTVSLITCVFLFGLMY